MAKMEDTGSDNQRIVESATEARQAEPGPSILLLLIASLGLAIIIMVAIYILFFRH